MTGQYPTGKKKHSVFPFVFFFFPVYLDSRTEIFIPIQNVNIILRKNFHQHIRVKRGKKKKHQNHIQYMCDGGYNTPHQHTADDMSKQLIWHILGEVADDIILYANLGAHFIYSCSIHGLQHF